MVGCLPNPQVRCRGCEVVVGVQFHAAALPVHVRVQCQRIRSGHGAARAGDAEFEAIGLLRFRADVAADGGRIDRDLASCRQARQVHRHTGWLGPVLRILHRDVCRDGAGADWCATDRDVWLNARKSGGGVDPGNKNQALQWLRVADSSTAGAWTSREDSGWSAQWD